jgi:hypothetical protein
VDALRITPVPNDRPFVNAAVSADHDVILDDDRDSSYRLKHPADLYSGAEVHAFSDLGAGTHQRMAVNQCVFIDIGADIDVGRRHDDDARGNIGSVAHRTAAWDNPPSALRGEFLYRQRVFISEAEHAVVSDIGEHSRPKRPEYDPLDIRIGVPPAVDTGCGAQPSLAQGLPDSIEKIKINGVRIQGIAG